MVKHRIRPSLAEIPLNIGLGCVRPVLTGHGKVVTVGFEPTAYSSGNCRSIQLSYVTSHFGKVGPFAQLKNLV